jgi:hypothetical protein
VARLAIVVGAFFVGVVGLALAFDDPCGGDGQSRFLGATFVALSTGVITGVGVRRRFPGRPERTWNIAFSAAIVAFLLVSFFIIFSWADMCTE